MPLCCFGPAATVDTGVQSKSLDDARPPVYATQKLRSWTNNAQWEDDDGTDALKSPSVQPAANAQPPSSDGATPVAVKGMVHVGLSMDGKGIDGFYAKAVGRARIAGPFDEIMAACFAGTFMKCSDDVGWIYKFNVPQAPSVIQRLVEVGFTVRCVDGTMVIAGGDEHISHDGSMFTDDQVAISNHTAPSSATSPEAAAYSPAPDATSGPHGGNGVPAPNPAAAAAAAAAFARQAAAVHSVDLLGGGGGDDQGIGQPPMVYRPQQNFHPPMSVVEECVEEEDDAVVVLTKSLGYAHSIRSVGTMGTNGIGNGSLVTPFAASLLEETPDLTPTNRTLPSTLNFSCGMSHLDGPAKLLMEAAVALATPGIGDTPPAVLSVPRAGSGRSAPPAVLPPEGLSGTLPAVAEDGTPLTAAGTPLAAAAAAAAAAPPTFANLLPSEPRAAAVESAAAAAAPVVEAPDAPPRPAAAPEPGAALYSTAPRGDAAATVPPLPAPAEAVDAAANAERRIIAAVGLDVWSQLYPYQQEGVRFMVEKGGRALLADEMGLGKTLQALLTAAVFASEGSWPLLIVAPSALKLVWLEALYEWLPPRLLPATDDIWMLSKGLDIQKKAAACKGIVPANRPHVCITTYDLVRKMQGMEKQYKFIICDESHMLKTRDAQRTMLMTSLVRAAQGAILISGTPITTRPIDAWSQVHMLRPNLLGTYDAFGRKFCTAPGTPVQPMRRLPSGYLVGPDYRGAANGDELLQLLRDNLMVRRQKEDVAAQLPPKIRARVPVELSPSRVATEVRLQLREVLALQAARNARPLDMDLERDWNAALAAGCRLVGPGKVDATLDFLFSLMDRDDGEKVLLLGHHKEVLSMYAAALDKKSIRWERIDSDTSDRQRALAIDSFQNDPEVKVFLLSITSVAAGLNLSAASVAIFGELHWSATKMQQAEERIHHTSGDTHTVNIYYMTATDSSDDLVLAPASFKQRELSGAQLSGKASGSIKSALSLRASSRSLVRVPSAATAPTASSTARAALVGRVSRSASSRSLSTAVTSRSLGAGPGPRSASFGARRSAGPVSAPRVTANAMSSPNRTNRPPPAASSSSRLSASVGGVSGRLATTRLSASMGAAVPDPDSSMGTRTPSGSVTRSPVATTPSSASSTARSRVTTATTNGARTAVSLGRVPWSSSVRAGPSSIPRGPSAAADSAGASRELSASMGATTGRSSRLAAVGGSRLSASIGPRQAASAAATASRGSSLSSSVGGSSVVKRGSPGAGGGGKGPTSTPSSARRAASSRAPVSGASSGGGGVVRTRGGVSATARRVASNKTAAA